MVGLGVVPVFRGGLTTTALRGMPCLSREVSGEFSGELSTEGAMGRCIGMDMFNALPIT